MVGIPERVSVIAKTVPSNFNYFWNSKQVVCAAKNIRNENSIMTVSKTDATLFQEVNSVYSISEILYSLCYLLCYISNISDIFYF